MLQLDSRSETALLQLGRLEMESKNYAEAARHLRRASELRRDNAEVAFEYGRVLDLSGDLPGARHALQGSLKLNPEQPAARLLLGQVCLKSNDPKAAEGEFEAALLLQPASVEGQIGLAKALLRQKKFGDAVGLLEESTTSSGNNAEFFDLLAQAYTGLGKSGPAQKAKDKAKQLRSTKAPH